MSGSVQLDPAAARRAVADLATRLGADLERTAGAMIATADAAMARALRRVSVERGIDPRDCVLIAFGGGGPLHACGLAEQLGMTRILVPPFAGVLSALGLAVAPPRRVAYASVMRGMIDLDSSALGGLASDLAERAGADRDDWETQYILRMRYRGQGHELEVPFALRDDSDALASRFARAHHARYGFVLELPVEAVSARCVRSGTAPGIRLARHGTATWQDSVRRDDGSPSDAVVRGRAVIALPDATLLVAERWTARALPIGGWLLRQDA